MTAEVRDGLDGQLQLLGDEFASVGYGNTLVLNGEYDLAYLKAMVKLLEKAIEKGERNEPRKFDRLMG